jgi:hypothetical protein
LNDTVWTWFTFCAVKPVTKTPRSGIGNHRAHFHLAMQCSVHRATIGDLEQPLPLLVRQLSGELQFTFEPVDTACGRFAVLAIPGVNLAVPHTNGGRLEVEVFV